MVAHDGSDGTFFYDFRWFPKEKLTVLYATNALTRSVQGIAWEVDKMLFDEKYTPKEIKVDVLSELLQFTENYTGKLAELETIIKQKFGKKLNRPFYLNRMCGIHLQKSQIEKALVFGRLNVELFPKNANNWDTLGEVYYKKGDTTKALECYQKALRLDPLMESSKQMIKKINQL